MEFKWIFDIHGSQLGLPHVYKVAIYVSTDTGDIAFYKAEVITNVSSTAKVSYSLSDLILRVIEHESDNL
jgi:hypothetical protein